jgi:hypothetical protein
MDAWSGILVPFITDIGTFDFSRDEKNLDIGCLSKSIAEFELNGQAP